MLMQAKKLTTKQAKSWGIVDIAVEPVGMNILVFGDPISGISYITFMLHAPAKNFQSNCLTRLLSATVPKAADFHLLKRRNKTHTLMH